MNPDQAQHWHEVYESKLGTEVSWFEERPTRSLELIERAGLAPDAAIVDVGGGASRLARELVAAGYRNVTVADIAATALEQARKVMGEAADRVTYVQADVTAGLEGTYDLWHDRALLHFMVEEAAREAYVRSLRASVAEGGYAILATFGPEGPTSCSGLPVLRYGADELAALIGPGFSLLEAAEDVHTTPGGKFQQFVYALFHRH